MTAKNMTYYATDICGSVEYPSRSVCMAVARDTTGIMKIIVKFKDLNKGISHDDVLLWNKLGNQTIFPAEITKGYTSGFSLSDMMQVELSKKKILVRPKDGDLTRADYRNIKIGKLFSASFGRNNSYNTTLEIVESKNNSYPYTGVHWSINSDDFILNDTGKPLTGFLDSVVKNYKIKQKIDDTVENCYIISIDCNKIKSRSHRLAILTYYRYLYSELYNGIVSDTIKVFSTGIPAWESILLAHAAERDIMYNNYYALTNQRLRGFRKMERVLSTLNRNWLINDSFNPKRSVQINNFSISSTKDFSGLVEILSSVDEYPELVTCTVKHLSTLKLGKQYTVKEEDETIVKVQAEDWVNRWYSKKHFK